MLDATLAIPLPTPEVLFHRRSARQLIELIRETDGSLSFTLDEFWQFSTLDEHVFHEVLVDPAMRVAPRIANVLILGGGDGLALRNVLRYPEVERVVLCEIDGDVIEMTRTVPEMVALTENSLEDPRVEVCIADAMDYLPTIRDRFDVVICDFPVAGAGRSAPEYNKWMCDQLALAVTLEGVITVQVSHDPPEFWPVLDALAVSFPWIEPRLVELVDDSWADFILASRQPHSAQRAFAKPLRSLTPARSDALRIMNRSGVRFETLAYPAQA